jgi:hypothetical protein
MRKFCLISLSFSALSSAAVTLDVARLPEPSYADCEVSQDSALPANRTENLRVFRLEMTFDATPSNNVQVAFGRDSLPADGALAAEETDFIVGWDCGEWFLRPQGLRERYAAAAAITNGTRTLTAAVRVTSRGVCLPPVFKDGDAAFAFDGLALSPFPDWLKHDRWTSLRVTVRGGSSANETVSARFLPDGARIIIK